MLLEKIHSKRQVSYKPGKYNIVTDVDILAEKTIIALLQSEYPDFNILSEESQAENNGSAYTWVIDPLDGTNNYAHGLPFYSVSVALMNSEEVILGTVYDPWMKELFTAEKGTGTWLNGQRVALSDRKKMEGSFVGCDMGYDTKAGARTLEIIKGSWPKMVGLRIMGSAVLGLAYVASGRLDLYIHSYLYPWDVASGILLVKEAGGVVTDWEGKPSAVKSGEVLAGNSTIHQEAMGLIKDQLRF